MPTVPVNIAKHLAMLGMRVRCKITGAEGVVTAISFDLPGCVQAIVNRGYDKDGKAHDPIWADCSRLDIISKEPVMARPTFEWTPEAVSAGEKGAIDKPSHPNA